MGNLTVKEKEHWKERIDRKVNQAIERLIAQTDPTFRERIAEKAAELARESLGIVELDQRVAAIKAEEERLSIEKDQLLEQIARKVAPAETAKRRNWENERLIKVAIDRRRAVHEQELMASESLGQQLLSLEQEKEEMLDTVWLATSGAQIKELWRQVADMLQQPPTALQEEALKLEPSEDE